MIQKIFIFIYFIVIFSTISCQRKREERNKQILDNSKIYNLQTEWKVKAGNYPDAISETYNDSDWKNLLVPGFWRNLGLEGNRHVWYRIKIFIGKDFANKELGIFVPGIFEGYELFFNGHLIGKDGETDKNGNLIKSTIKINFFPINPSIVHIEKENTIALHVMDQYNFGGITGNFYIGEYELIKQKFIFYIIRSIAMNSFSLAMGIAFFLMTIGKKDLLMFFSFSILLIANCFYFFFMERISGWLITNFVFLNYSFLISQVIFSITYLNTTIYFFEFRSNFFIKFISYGFYPVFIISILSGINKEFLQMRNSVFGPIVYSYAFLCLLCITYIIIYTLLMRKKIVGIQYASIGASILVFFSLKTFYDYFTKVDEMDASSLSLVFNIFFLFILYSLTLQYRDKLQKLREIEIDYRERLEEEIKVKTKNLLKSNKELKASNKMRDRLFSIIAHDLRSPLDSLKMVLGLFHNKILSAEQLKTNIVELSSLLEENRLFLENLLCWASFQRGYTKVIFKKFDLLLLSKKILKLQLYNAKQKKIHLRIVANKSLIINSDENIIYLVLNNLVSNAIKFTPTKGTVEIHLIETKTHVGISVVDTGIGISADEERFMESTENYLQVGTNSEKSTGLGLNLCKEYLSKLDSELFYEKNPTLGSTFSFYLKK